MNPSISPENRHGCSSWRLAMWAAIPLLLLLPLLAMQFTREVSWTAADFVAAAALLIGAGGAYEILSRRIPDTRRRLICGAIIIAAVALIWAESAVGVF